MKRIALLSACVLLLATGLALRAKSQSYSGFNNDTLHDKYGFHVLALNLDLPDSNFTTGASFPFAVSGYYDFHGDGTLNGSDTVSTHGNIIPRQYTGTYQVNPDGTGTLQLNISPVFKPVGNFTIVENGREIEIIFAVPQNLNAFTLRKQHLDN